MNSREEVENMCAGLLSRRFPGMGLSEESIFGFLFTYGMGEVCLSVARTVPVQREMQIEKERD